MTRSKAKVKVTEAWRLKCAQNGRFQSLSPAPTIRRLIVNYDPPRQCVIFFRRDFWHSSSFGECCSLLAIEHCLLRGVDRQSCVGGLFLVVFTVLSYLYRCVLSDPWHSIYQSIYQRGLTHRRCSVGRVPKIFGWVGNPLMFWRHQ